MTLDAVEAALDVEERGGGPAGDLVGLQAPAGDPGGLAAVVPHDVLNGVGGQEGEVERGRDVELMQGDEVVAGLREAHRGSGV